jgi:hypothetical protein
MHSLTSNLCRESGSNSSAPCFWSSTTCYCVLITSTHYSCPRVQVERVAYEKTRQRPSWPCRVIHQSVAISYLLVFRRASCCGNEAQVGGFCNESRIIAASGCVLTPHADDHVLTRPSSLDLTTPSHRALSSRPESHSHRFTWTSSNSV